MWTRNDKVVNTTRATATVAGSSSIYRDHYTLSRLNTSDDDIIYKCRLVVHVNPSVEAEDTVSLDVTGKYFTEMYVLLHKYM